jgi:hypothetical protein
MDRHDAPPIYITIPTLNVTSADFSRRRNAISHAVGEISEMIAKKARALAAREITDDLPSL